MVVVVVVVLRVISKGPVTEVWYGSNCYGCIDVSNFTFAIPSHSFSARAFELARKCPMDLP